MSMRLDQILDFVGFINRLQQVERRILIHNSERFENDLEHQYQLALVAWYLIKSEKLKLNLLKTIQYALAHDIVEIYAGDTWVFDDKHRKTKIQRELAAVKKIQKEFPEFPNLPLIIKKYEARRDKESRFVYALDKLVPILNIYLDGGRNWKRQKVSLQKMVTKKLPMVTLSPIVRKYFDHIVLRLKKEEKKLFKF